MNAFIAGAVTAALPIVLILKLARRRRTKVKLLFLLALFNGAVGAAMYVATATGLVQP